MKSTLTSKGQITLPVELRRRLNLKTGDVLEFDEKAPYIKAVKPYDKNHFRASLQDLGVERMSTSQEAVLQAGRIFRSYRDAG